MHDMVKIYTIVLETMEALNPTFPPPPLRSVSCFKYTGSDRVYNYCLKVVYLDYYSIDSELISNKLP